MKKERPVKRADSSDNAKQHVYDHPAFGVIRVSNCHGGSQSLLGSDLTHSDYITLEIAPAELHRSYGENRVFGQRKPIIKVAMTHSSFLNITQSIGNTQGVPVTLQYAPSTLNQDVVMIPSIEPLESSLDRSKEELEQTVHKHVGNALEAINTLKQLVQAKKTGKALLEQIEFAENQIGLLPVNLKSSVDFAKESLDKAADEIQTDTESKIKIRLTALGIQSLGGDSSKLLQIDAPPKQDTNESS